MEWRAARDEEAPPHLATLAREIAPQEGVAEPEKYLVHAKRCVLSDFTCLLERHAYKAFSLGPLDQDLARLHAVIKPTLDPQVILERRLNLVDWAVVLAGEDTIASLNRASLYQPRTRGEMHEYSFETRITAIDLYIPLFGNDCCRVEGEGEAPVEFVDRCVKDRVDGPRIQALPALLLPHDETN